MATITGVLARPTGYAGIWGWITTVDHKRIGVLYGVTAFIMLLIAGSEAGIMRAQLAQPDSTLVGAETFNRLFTMHATAMVFMVIMPLSASFFNFVVPLAIGARDVAFPRLNAFSYWVFLFGTLLMHASFLVNAVPNAGWFSYANLTGTSYSPNAGLDFWALGLLILGISSVAAALNFLVTIVNMRCPGVLPSALGFPYSGPGAQPNRPAYQGESGGGLVGPEQGNPKALGKKPGQREAGQLYEISGCPPLRERRTQSQRRRLGRRRCLPFELTVD